MRPPSGTGHRPRNLPHIPTYPRTHPDIKHSHPRFPRSREQLGPSSDSNPSPPPYPNNPRMFSSRNPLPQITTEDGDVQYQDQELPYNPASSSDAPLTRPGRIVSRTVQGSRSPHVRGTSKVVHPPAVTPLPPNRRRSPLQGSHIYPGPSTPVHQGPPQSETPPGVINGNQRFYKATCIVSCKGSQSRTLVRHSHTLTPSGGLFPEY